MKNFCSTILFSLVSAFLFAQNPCACCTDNNKNFDFWVGDWIVFDTAGNKVGENTITKVEGECLILENWRGESGSTGRSQNYYSATDSSWHQIWVDNSGFNLVLQGSGDGQKMVMKSELLPGQKIDFYANRITWELNDDQSVTQTWDILDKSDNVVNTVFIGIYKRLSTGDDVFDALMAKKYGADDYGMHKYVIAFLKRGPNRDRTEDEVNKLQAAHMANINRLAEEGKLILAGPFFGDGELRGLYLFDVSSIKEAEELTNSDPAIKAGSLEMELLEWYGSAALMAIPEIHMQVAKIKM